MLRRGRFTWVDIRSIFLVHAWDGHVAEYVLFSVVSVLSRAAAQRLPRRQLPLPRRRDEVQHAPK